MRQVFQFKITLLGSNPIIWRRIQISTLCTFWSLHVAIQDAMGWEDYHLHDFKVKDPKKPENVKGLRIGIPMDDDFEEYKLLAGWETKVSEYININKTILYTYDYGDGWEHEIEFEGLFAKSPVIKYPVCLAGANACPPEDVGGIGGYYEYVKAITDKNHPEHKHYLEWRGKFNPTKFDPKKIKFYNANARLKIMLANM